MSVRTLLGLVSPAPSSRTMLAYDASLAWATLLLLAIGLVMVYSASIAMAEASGHTGYRAWYFLARHGLFVVAGLVAATCLPPGPWQASQVTLATVALFTSSAAG